MQNFFFIFKQTDYITFVTFLRSVQPRIILHVIHYASDYLAQLNTRLKLSYRYRDFRGGHRGRTTVVHVTFAYHPKIADNSWSKLYVQLRNIFKFHLQPSDFYPMPKCMYTVWSVVIPTRPDNLYPYVIRIVCETNSGLADTSQWVYYTCSRIGPR